MIISTCVCQAELYKRAASELDRVLSVMPADRVNAVRGRVDELLKSGGKSKSKF